MLAKKYRLPVQSAPRHGGKAYQGRYFLVKVFPPGKEHSRVAVVAPTHLLPRAAMRNKAKRQVYALVQALYSSVPLRDYLILLRSRTYEPRDLDGMIKELTTVFTSQL